MLHFEISKSKDFSLLCGMDPFKSIAVPRPIAWISTVSKDGVDNLLRSASLLTSGSMSRMYFSPDS